MTDNVKIKLKGFDKKPEVKTMDLTPAWGGLIRWMCAVLEGTQEEEPRRYVRGELQRLAEFADWYNDQKKEREKLKEDTAMQLQNLQVAVDACSASATHRESFNQSIRILCERFEVEAPVSNWVNGEQVSDRENGEQI